VLPRWRLSALLDPVLLVVSERAGGEKVARAMSALAGL